MAVLSGLANDFGEAIVGFLNQVNFLTRTPENLSYGNDLVMEYAAAVQVLANGLLAVVVLITGYNVVLRPYMGATYAGAREVLPRLLLGGILINTAGWWCRMAIDVNNAACSVFGAPNIADMVSTMLRVILDPTHLSGLLMLLVATIMAILLLIQQLMRLALVDVLLILAHWRRFCGSCPSPRRGDDYGDDCLSELCSRRRSRCSPSDSAST